MNKNENCGRDRDKDRDKDKDKRKYMPKRSLLRRTKSVWKIVTFPPKTLFFIARNFRFLVTFGVGMYAGVYMAQNYDIPKVVDPAQLWKNIQDYLEQHKKP